MCHRIVEPADAGQRDTQIAARHHHVGIEHKRLFITLDGLLEPAQFGLNHAGIVMGFSQVGPQRCGALKMTQRLAHPARASQCHGEIHLGGDVVGIDLGRRRHQLHRFRGPALLHAQHAQHVARSHDGRILANDLDVEPFGFGQSSLLMQRHCLAGLIVEIRGGLGHARSYPLIFLLRRGGLGDGQGRHVHDAARRHRRYHHMHRLGHAQQQWANQQAFRRCRQQC